MYQEGKRELVSVLVGSFLYAFITLLMVSAGMEQKIGTLWTLVFSGMLSGLVNFVVSYLIVFKFWDWIYRNRTKLVAAVFLLLIFLLTQIGKVVR